VVVLSLDYKLSIISVTSSGLLTRYYSLGAEKLVNRQMQGIASVGFCQLEEV